MEFMTIVVLIAFTISNIAIVKNLKNLKWHPLDLEFTPLLETKGCNCSVGLTEEVQKVLSLLEEKKDKPLPKPDESYSAWKNNKEEPTVAPPSPHGPPPIPGPLERPYGFAR